MLKRLQIVTRVLLDKANYTDSLAQSPYFAGIICGSMIWVLYSWITRLLPGEWTLAIFALFERLNWSHTDTQFHSFAHLLFAISFGLCAYNFFRAITLDAGGCPKPQSDAELKSVSLDMLQRC